MSYELLQQRAAALLAMVENARERGDEELVRLLTEATCRCLDELYEAEQKERTGQPS
jgi:hypothetical protein